MTSIALARLFVINELALGRLRETDCCDVPDYVTQCQSIDVFEVSGVRNLK